MFLDIGLADWIQKIGGLTLSPEVRNEKGAWNSCGIWLDRCVDSGGTGSEAREGGCG